MSRKHAVLTTFLLVALVSLAGCHELIMGYTTPEWTSVAKHRDGRQFLTDGSIAIEVKIAEEDELPESTSSASWFSDALYQHSIAERQTLFALTDIKASKGNPEILIGPGQLQLEESHVSYLRKKIAASHRVTFWQHSRMQPLVIVVDGQGAGAIKPLAQP